MRKDDIREMGFGQIAGYGGADYMDEGIAFHSGFRELPIDEDTIRMDMVALVGCLSGDMSMDINGVTFSIGQNEVVVLRPNDMVSHCQLGDGFEGAILCMSQRKILEQMQENDLWDKVFRVMDNPVVRVSGESLHMLWLYGKTLQAKIGMGLAPYRQTIILSIVRAALYELLANIEEDTPSYGGGMIRQREVLFKRFIRLLADSRIRQRSVTWYADRLCVTPKHLSTICRQVSGKTALVWISEYVMADIRHWLRNSDKSVKEIADLLGFPTLSFFGKYCRAHFGLSPTDLRRKLRQVKSIKEKA